MDSDFAIVVLSGDLAAAFGTNRLLVEAVAMHGDAIFRGAYRTWKRELRVWVPGESAYVAPQYVRALEVAFVAALRLQATDDEQTIRDADYKHSKTREYGRNIQHSRNPIGMRHTMRSR